MPVATPSYRGLGQFGEVAARLSGQPRGQGLGSTMTGFGVRHHHAGYDNGKDELQDSEAGAGRHAHQPAAESDDLRFDLR